MEWIELGKLVDIRKGTKLIETCDNEDTDAIRMIMIEDLRHNKNIKYTIKNEKNVLINSEDIIIAWDGANAGLIGFNLNGALGSTLARLSLKSKGIYPNYLGLYLWSKFEEIRFNCTGATIPHVNRNHLINIEVPVPAINIQKQIVEVLDEAQNLIDNRKEQVKLLDDLIESIFYDIFGDPVKNDKCWEVEIMSKACTIKSLNIDDKFESSDLVWLVNLDEIESNTGRLLSKKEVKFSDLPSSIISFNNEYILYSKLRPYLNKLILPDCEGYGTSELVPILPKTYVNKIYLFNLLKSNSILRFLESHVSGAKMPRVVMKDFKNLEIPIPPIQLQNQFAEKVEQIESQKQLLQDSLKLLEDNYKSLMQRAFKGELF